MWSAAIFILALDPYTSSRVLNSGGHSRPITENCMLVDIVIRPQITCNIHWITNCALSLVLWLQIFVLMCFDDFEKFHFDISLLEVLMICYLSLLLNGVFVCVGVCMFVLLQLLGGAKSCREAHDEWYSAGILAICQVLQNSYYAWNSISLWGFWWILALLDVLSWQLMLLSLWTSWYIHSHGCRLFYSLIAMLSAG